MLGTDIIEQLKQFPVTNLVGEHAFGHLDYDITRRRNSTVHHRSSCKMLLWNSTVDWLSNQSKQQQEDLMTKAHKIAPALQLKHCQQEALVRLKVKERILQVERQKKEKEAKLRFYLSPLVGDFGVFQTFVTLKLAIGGCSVKVR
ncbi:hypothetical protein PoB_005200800 [Plakobranchus ocellatus]|uniref:Uncharacterized protein n=1 Tax=Plakobranchus ocellatus TaxID=259542 RepID=A0AAV4C255_9GAST|nr:hypothetical protein PoB_005200800 [Plakobranchus ocellatus]